MNRGSCFLARPGSGSYRLARLKVRGARRVLRGFLRIVPVLCLWTLLPAPSVVAGRLPRYGGNVRVELSSLPTTLDPRRLTGEEAHLISSCLYEGLTRFGAEGVQPSLARSWVKSSDARRWVFMLRSNVQFHDGTFCDAATVQASLQRLADPRESNFSWLLSNLKGWADFSAGRTSEIEGLLVVEANEIELQFQTPVQDLPTRLALPEASIVRPSGRTLVGTGPFRVVSSGRESVRLVAWEGYHGGRPFFDGLDLVTNADPRLTPWGRDAVMKRVMATTNVPSDSRSVNVPAYRLGLAIIHPASGALSSGRDRQRIAESFDRSVFVQATLAGFGEAAHGLQPGAPGSVASDAAEREGDLLQHPRETVRIIVPEAEPVLRRLGERLQVHLFAFGFAAVLDVLKPDAFEVALLADRYDIVLMGWTAPQPREHAPSEEVRVRYTLASLLEPAMRDQLPNAWASMWRGEGPFTETRLLAGGHLIPLVFFHDGWQVSSNMVRVQPGAAIPRLGLEAAHLIPGTP